MLKGGKMMAKLTDRQRGRINAQKMERRNFPAAA